MLLLENWNIFFDLLMCDRNDSFLIVESLQLLALALVSILFFGRPLERPWFDDVNLIVFVSSGPDVLDELLDDFERIQRGFVSELAPSCLRTCSHLGNLLLLC